MKMDGYVKWRIRVATSQLVEAINQYGFPIIAALGLGYFVYYVWRWATMEIKPVLGESYHYLTYGFCPQV